METPGVLHNAANTGVCTTLVPSSMLKRVTVWPFARAALVIPCTASRFLSVFTKMPGFMIHASSQLLFGNDHTRLPGYEFIAGEYEVDDPVIVLVPSDVHHRHVMPFL